VRLDFGGIAKGWAADQAVRRLAVHGPALVNAGGDIAVSGPRQSGDGWLIGIDAPLGLELPADTQLELIALRTGGVATSGRDYRRWQQNGAWQHHIIDPRSGVPADTDVLAATVIAPTAGDAEVAAKVVLLLGSSAGLDWLDARPALAALLVLETGEVLHSRRLPAFLENA
jgi:thiamine biosynthesis lipoprotein